VCECGVEPVVVRDELALALLRRQRHRGLGRCSPPRHRMPFNSNKRGFKMRVNDPAGNMVLSRAAGSLASSAEPEPCTACRVCRSRMQRDQYGPGYGPGRHGKAGDVVIHRHLKCPQVSAVRVVGPGRYCSPRHRMPFDSRNEGSNRPVPVYWLPEVPARLKFHGRSTDIMCATRWVPVHALRRQIPVEHSPGVTRYAARCANGGARDPTKARDTLK
jgi:hypothetical protein